MYLITKLNHIFKLFSDTYIDYLLSASILQDINQGRYIEFTGREILESGIVAAPDYYIRNGNKTFLFESKDIFINAAVKTSVNFNLIEEEFRNKLYYSGTKKKAVLQLINNVERVLKKEFPFDTRYKANSVYIYPILVLHDRQFNLTGLNQLINAWFSKELMKLQNAGLNTTRVRPVTLIDIDTFILYQDILRNRKIKLDEIIENYFEFITLSKKKN